jgi:hypothetical protein
MPASDGIPELVRRLYALVGELEALFPGRKFTPDGHLVGSLGEAIAQYRYGLQLLPCSSAVHDAVARDGRQVQVKATQTTRVALYSKPEHLIVLRVHRDGSAEEVFNGPGEIVWPYMSPVSKNGQSSISTSRLRSLMSLVLKDQRIPTV